MNKKEATQLKKLFTQDIKKDAERLKKNIEKIDEDYKIQLKIHEKLKK